MKKNDSSLVSSSSFFRTPVPYPERKPSDTIVLGVVSDENGNSVVVRKCVETEMSKIVALNYVETTLSSLVSKGIDPHSLDIIDSSKLGIDSGIDQLARYLVDHTSDYVTLKSSLDSSISKVELSK